MKYHPFMQRLSFSQVYKFDQTLTCFTEKSDLKLSLKCYDPKYMRYTCITQITIYLLYVFSQGYLL